MSKQWSYRNRLKYLTPDSPTGDPVIRSFLLPNSDYPLQAIFDGAISMLFESESFEQHGTMTEDETAQWFRDIELVMNLCEYIANCIENSPETQQALTQYFNNQQIGGNYPYNQALAQSQDLLSGSCDNDEIWGQINAILDYINKVIEDSFESIEGWATIADLIAKLAKGIPLVASVVGVAEWFAGSFKTAYQSSYNSTIKAQMACDLYCMVTDCQLNSDDMISYFSSNAGIAISSITEALGFISNMYLLGQSDPVVHFAHALVMYCISQDIQFLNQNLASLKAIAISGIPDNGHLNCDECSNEWCYIVNFYPTMPENWVIESGTMTPQGVLPDETTGIARVAIEGLNNATFTEVKFTGLAYHFDPNEYRVEFRNSNDFITYARNQNIPTINENTIRVVTLGDVATKQADRIEYTLYQEPQIWTHTIDFVNGVNIPSQLFNCWTFDPPYQSPLWTPNWYDYQAGLGVSDVQGADIDRHLFLGILWDYGQNTNQVKLRSIETTWSKAYQIISSAGQSIEIVRYAPDFTDGMQNKVLQVAQTTTSNTIQGTLNWYGEFNSVSYGLSFTMAYNDALPQTNGYLTAVTITGTGLNPFTGLYSGQGLLKSFQIKGSGTQPPLLVGSACS